MDHMTRILRSAAEIGVKALAVKRKGELLCELRPEDGRARDVYSVSKSLTSLAVCFAVEEGLLKLDERLEDIFDTSMKGVTIRHLLTMQLGNREPRMMLAERRHYTPDFDWLYEALHSPQENAPGDSFVYSNHGPYIAGVIVQQRAGEDLVTYLQNRLFGPLGIPRPEWLRDDRGRVFGSSGLKLRLDDLLSLGECLLREGGGIIPAKQLREATKEQVRLNPADFNGPHWPGYGYLFWRGPHNSYRADGKFGQLIVVFPEKKAVIVTQSEARDETQLFELVHGPLYEAL